MVLAKALGGGLPIGALVVKESIADTFKPGMHASTFGGSPLVCRASLGVFKAIFSDKMLKNTKLMGAYILKELNKLKSRFSCITDVRGLGLMIGVELTDEAFGGILMPEMLKRGVLIAYTLNNPKVVRFEPPLMITKKEIDFVLSAFHESLEKSKALVGKL